MWSCGRFLALINLFTAIMTTNPHWKRPFVKAYASHSACFLALQILTLSRIFVAVETDYTLKIRILMGSDIAAVSVVLIGIVQTFPYLKQVFRQQEIVVDHGPSLITELIPSFLLSLAILLTCAIFFCADYSIHKHINLDIARVVYAIFAALSLPVSIASVHDYRERVIASCTGLACCVSTARWFSDFGIIVPVSLACTLLAYVGFCDSQRCSTVCTQTEVEILRVRSIFLLIVALGIVNAFFQPFAVLSLFIVFICNCSLYIQERRFGALHERPQFATVTV